jgi:Mg2+ and Co2+ transporter CorA
MSKNYIITLHREPIEGFAAVVKKWDKYRKRPIFWLVNRIIEEITDTYTEEISRMESLMDELEAYLTTILSTYLLFISNIPDAVIVERLYVVKRRCSVIKRMLSLTESLYTTYYFMALNPLVMPRPSND